MTRRKASLSDKFDLSKERVLLTGAQAAVRLLLMQHERDRRAGLDTAGYVSGYRGSPIAGLEGQLKRAERELKASNIIFQPGLNEDLAATAIWGTQQAELRGEGKYQGVIGMWYGKGPGVDRSGDALRHANHAGTSRYGGVVALMGDDHTCESSTTAHQSEWTFIDLMMPVLNPAGVQDMLDFGIHGYALSRYAGVWVGLKCVKDNFESTAVVDGRVDRVEVKIPTDFAMPEGGLNIRLGDPPLAREARLHLYKRDAAVAYSRANKLDRTIMSGGPNKKIGIVSTGKSYLDTRQALDDLGIDEKRAHDLGIGLYKVGMIWPFEPQGFLEFAKGFDLIMVVEEKRMIVEVEVKEELFHKSWAPDVIGKRDEHGNWLFPAHGALEPTQIGIAIAERVLRYHDDAALKARLSELRRIADSRPSEPELATRLPYFCAGCPHNTSTVVPEGSRAYAGIGCHYMAQWMDRSTDGFTHMGGEGVNWVGEANFSKRRHVFQNLGDGTYIHSGSLAVRAAIAAGVNITYKILYNDAVAMTGGQPLDGGKTVQQIAAEMTAEGARRVVVVTDEPEKYAGGPAFPHGVAVEHRDDLDKVQRELRAIDGVTVLIYDQTCAAEKRRRRKRGAFPDPAKRVFINTEVCEGCGDCGVKSNCVAIVPVETELGRKRAIDQSACNKDYSCVKGFCPSFVTVHGGSLRKPAAGRSRTPEIDSMIAALPEPQQPSLEAGPYNMLITGVGGTGVVTISAVLGEAAYLDGKGFGSIDMTGLAQKGGAVACHTRVAKSPDQIHAIRMGLGNADLLLGCDLVVSAAKKTLESVQRGRTVAVINIHETLTGAFTRDPEMRLPGMRMRKQIEERAGAEHVHMLDAHDLAVRLFGDSIAGNMLLLGFAYQIGRVPVSSAAIEQAIELNGVQIEMNRGAFRLGRLAAHDREAFERLAGMPEVPAEPKPKSLDEIIADRKQRLTGYQNAAWAERYAERIARIAEAERRQAPGKSGLAEAAAHALYKLMSTKDEYEVARLYTDGTFAREVARTFDGDYTLHVHLAPPLFARKDPVTGLPRKTEFGPWMLRAMRLLAAMKGLRGTMFDVFGMTAERRHERQMLADYERLLDTILARLSVASHATAVELASLPLMVKGFGHVKHANWEKAQSRQSELLARLDNPTPSPAEPEHAAAA